MRGAAGRRAREKAVRTAMVEGESLRRKEAQSEDGRERSRE